MAAKKFIFIIILIQLLISTELSEARSETQTSQKEISDFWLRVAQPISANISGARGGTPIPPKEISDPWNIGSTCVPISSYTDNEMGLVCRDYLTPYYNMTYADAYTPVRLAIVQAAQILFLFPEQCGYAVIRWICSTMFPECIPDVPIPNTNTTITLQRYSCRDLCDDVSVLCYESYINIVGATPAQAAADLKCDPPIGLKYFYGNTTRDIFMVPLNGTKEVTVTDIPDPSDPFNPALYWNYTTTCFDENRFLVVGQIPFTCPDQYGFTRGDEFCNFKCPYPIISLNKYIFLWAWTGSLAFISMIACVLVIIFYTCLSKFRKAIIHEIFNILIALTIYSFAFVIALPIGYKEMWCDGDEPNLWGHVGCTIQGILIVYSLWAAVLWWFVLIIELFVTIVISSCSAKTVSIIRFHQLARFKLFTIPKHRPIMGTIWYKIKTSVFKRECDIPSLIEEDDVMFKTVPIIMMISVWSLASLPMLIGLSSQHLGFSGGDAWCTIHNNEKIEYTRSLTGITKSGGSDADGWDLGLMTVPLALIVFTGTILVIIFMIVLIFGITCRQIKSLDLEGKSKKQLVKAGFLGSVKTAWDSTTSQKRLIAFVLLMLLILVVNLIFRIVYTVQKPQMIDELSDSMTCVFQQESASYVQPPGSITDETIDKLCSPEELISYWLWVINVTLTGSMGLLISCALGCSRELFKECYRCLRRKSSGNNSHHSGDTFDSSTATSTTTVPGRVKSRSKMSIPVGVSSSEYPDSASSGSSDSSTDSSHESDRNSPREKPEDDEQEMNQVHDSKSGETSDD